MDYSLHDYLHSTKDGKEHLFLQLNGVDDAFLQLQYVVTI
jgi:hypothetical protein